MFVDTKRTAYEVIVGWELRSEFFSYVTTQVHVVLNLLCEVSFILSFFFVADNGIRVRDVTRVRTCAIPIWGG